MSNIINGIAFLFTGKEHFNSQANKYQTGDFLLPVPE